MDRMEKIHANGPTSVIPYDSTQQMAEKSTKNNLTGMEKNYSRGFGATKPFASYTVFRLEGVNMYDLIRLVM